MRAQVLGLFGDIVNGIGSVFSGIANWFSDRIGQYIDYFVSIILKFVYEILKIFFIIIDFVQMLFRKIAGLDTVRYNGEENISGDIAWWLFRQPAVTDALLSLMIVAVVMLFMATFIAIIRNNYKAKDAKETAVGPVIGQAFKALFSFIMVPVVCYFGVFVSNGLLKTVDQATRISDSVSISGEVFSASAMSANRARTSSEFAATLQETEGLNFNIFRDDNTGVLTGKTAADKIDRAFATQQKIDEQELTINDSMAGCEFMFHQNSPGTISQFDYRNTDLVFVYYDFTKFNWLFAFVSCFFITTTLLYAAMGVVQRLFEITLLFAVSPPFIALMPLDGGSAFKNWAQKFIQSTVVMYGTVVALNFFFIVAPLLQQIDLFYTAQEIADYGSLTCDLFNGFAHILFIMCGALMIKDFTGILTELTAGKAGSLTKMGEGGYGSAANSAKAMANKASAVHNVASKSVAAGRKALKDHYSPKKVAERKTARDKKSANKAVAQGMRDAGEVGYWGSRRLIAEQNAADAGKETLRTRAHRKLYGSDNAKLSAKVDDFKKERNSAMNTYAINRNNSEKGGLVGKIKNGGGSVYRNLKSGKWDAVTATGKSRKEVSRDVGERHETKEMKEYRKQRDMFAQIEPKKKALVKTLVGWGQDKKSAKEIAANNTYHLKGYGFVKASDVSVKKAAQNLKKSQSFKPEKPPKEKKDA